MTQEIKDHLTGKEVKVKICGRIKTGIVRGRLEPFASVWIPGANLDIAYAWPTVERAVNTGSVLTT